MWCCCRNRNRNPEAEVKGPTSRANYAREMGQPRFAVSLTLARHSGARGCRDWHRFEVRREVAQEWRFVGQAQAGDVGTVPPDFEDYLDYIIDVALGVDAARDGQAD